ncbi:alanine racemase [Ahrensia marina]|uniref:alanine racemase n=1 Tax=Ahrensia marina TaxID=1514904 RepID=UPI0035CEF3EC
MCPTTTDFNTVDHSGGHLTVNLGSIAQNWRLLAKLAAPGECAGVVKGNAYGIGLEPVAHTLWNAGCKTFFVALPQEAFELRTYLPDATIYCLGGLTPTGAADYAAHRINPCLNTMDEVREWAALDGEHQAALHVDTGMTRLGLTMEEASSLALDNALLGRLNLTHVMSHLACADEPTHPLNNVQIANFEQVRSLFPGLPGSLANSAGTLQGARFRHDLARPGIALYGGQSVVPAPEVLHPVVTLEARVMQVRLAKAGDIVGYGATKTLERDSRIAILGVGYADGYHRLVGNAPDAHVMINDQPAPMLGRVSMDLIATDITEPHFDDVRPGMFVELINSKLTVDVVAGWAKTIGYEVLTGLGPRYRRTFLGG